MIQSSLPERHEWFLADRLQSRDLHRQRDAGSVSNFSMDVSDTEKATYLHGSNPAFLILSRMIGGGSTGRRSTKSVKTSLARADTFLFVGVANLGTFRVLPHLQFIFDTSIVRKGRIQWSYGSEPCGRHWSELMK